MMPRIRVACLVVFMLLFAGRSYAAISIIAEYPLGEPGSIGPFTDADGTFDVAILDTYTDDDFGYNGTMTIREDFGAGDFSVGTQGVFAPGSTHYLDTSDDAPYGWYAGDSYEDLPDDNLAFGIFVRTSAAVGNRGDIWATGDTTAGLYKFALTANGWEAQIEGASNAIVESIGSPAPLVADTWTHLALVRQSGMTSFFVDGIQQGTSTATAPIYSGALLSLNSGGTVGFDGHLDEARILQFETTDSKQSILDALTTGPPLPALSINTVTGETILSSDVVIGGRVIGYEISSLAATPALNANGWKSIADFYDADSTPPPGGVKVDVDDTWTKISATASNIAEAELSLSTGDGFALPPGFSLSLGQLFTPGASQQDLSMKLLLDDGSTLSVPIAFETPEGLAGDFNADGKVNAADYTVWRDNLGGSSAALNGNGSGSPTVVQADYTLWKSQYGAGGSGSSELTSVPEPSSVWLVLAAALGGLVSRPRWGRGSMSLRLVVTGLLALSALGDAAWAARQIDRDLRLGDDVLELGANGSPLGSNNSAPAINGYTLDSSGPSNAYYDLSVAVAPTYVSTTNRPGATASEQGAQFNGTSTWLFQDVPLNAPSLFASNPDLNPPYPLNYSGLLSHGIQVWAKPDVPALTSGVRQDLVLDTPQHGIYVASTGQWGLQYAGASVDSSVAATSTLDANGWVHVMQLAGFDAPVRGNSNAGGVLLVNGVAVAASPSRYNPDDSVLSVGANLEGSGNYYKGALDDLELFLWGNNSDTGGTNYGTLNLGDDNEWIVKTLTSLGVTNDADVNLDGSLNATDITAFVSNWKYRRLVNNVQVGDWTSRQHGDLNYDGIVDLGDVFVLHEAMQASGMGSFDFALLSQPSVPEPATATLLLSTIAAAAGMRRRKHTIDNRFES